MENILTYIKNNWLVVLVGLGFLSMFLYLTYTGNQFCDCAKTETYKDGTVRHNSGRAFYRYYHK